MEDRLIDKSDHMWFEKIALEMEMEKLDEKEKMIIYMRYQLDYNQEAIASNIWVFLKLQVSRLREENCDKVENTLKRWRIVCYNTSRREKWKKVRLSKILVRIYQSDYYNSGIHTGRSYILFRSLVLWVLQWSQLIINGKYHSWLIKSFYKERTALL
ncbi:MAG: hypothetical protein ACLSBH_09860 [Coprobacillus cateniformis]